HIIRIQPKRIITGGSCQRRVSSGGEIINADKVKRRVPPNDRTISTVKTVKIEASRRSGLASPISHDASATKWALFQVDLGRDERTERAWPRSIRARLGLVSLARRSRPDRLQVYPRETAWPTTRRL